MHDNYAGKTELSRPADHDAEATLFMLNCYDVWSATPERSAEFDCAAEGE